MHSLCTLSHLIMSFYHSYFNIFILHPQCTQSLVTSITFLCFRPSLEHYYTFFLKPDFFEKREGEKILHRWRLQVGGRFRKTIEKQNPEKTILPVLATRWKSRSKVGWWKWISEDRWKSKRWLSRLVVGILAYCAFRWGLLHSSNLIRINLNGLTFSFICEMKHIGKIVTTFTVRCNIPLK